MGLALPSKLASAKLGGSVRGQLRKKVVRVVGIEPTLREEPDFEVNRGFYRT